MLTRLWEAVSKIAQFFNAHVVIETRETTDVFTTTKRLRTAPGTDHWNGVMEIKSRRHDYVIMNPFRFMPDGIKHSYSVSMTLREEDGDEKKFPELNFPLFSSSIFVGTQYPHTLAINAYFRALSDD